jgi:RND family efflux transporter MFP subunit
VKSVFLMLALTMLSSSCRDNTPPADEHGGEEDAQADSTRVTLSDAAFVTAEIVVEPAIGQTIQQAARGLEVPGDVDFDARRVAIISPRVGGRIERLLVVSGDRVRAGQPVAMLYTPAYISAQTEYLQARRRAELLANTTDAQGARALADAAAARLRQIGVSAAEIERLSTAGDIRDNLTLTAPFSGSIVESPALAGSAVEAGAPLFKLADLSIVDVIAAVPERSIPFVRVGGKAAVHIAAYPQIVFSGEVERVQQQLDESTRTIGAVIHVRNVNETLKPGMFATVRLELPTATAASGMTTVVTIPESAVLSEGDQRFVFVEVAPRTFEKREVEVASLEAPGASQALTNRVIARSGLRPGERVAVRGAFTLKSELGKAALGEHGH